MNTASIGRIGALAAAMAAAFPGGAAAAPEDDIRELRAQLRQLQSDYEQRIQALEKRLARAESAPAGGPPAGATPAQAPEAGRTAGAAAAGDSAFNPAISLILQGAWQSGKGGERHITGFVPAGEHEHGARGFNLDHTELVLSANVDPYFRGLVNVAYADDETSVEEAWFQTLGLGRGVTLKGGRFLSGVGYQNEQHPHAWDFADNNLMYGVLFGENLRQDGLQLKWLVPAQSFVELGVEVARGQAFPGSAAGGDRNGAGTWAAFAHVGDDIGSSHGWRAGLSWVQARPRDRAGVVEDLNDVEAATAFSGRSRTWIADFVWKWAPEGNSRERSFKFQAEYFRRSESGELACADNSASGGACGDVRDAYRARQSGWYAQAVYGFAPRWRTGLRFDRLDAGSVDLGANAGFLPASAFRPGRTSLMLDYSPSEFSRFRLQLARDKSMQGSPDNRVTLQYIHSLGSHGAHRF